MSDISIKVENLSKQYRLGTVGTGTISHDLNRWWARVRGKEDPFLKIGETNDRSQKGNSDYVWALKDINFEVKQGEVLGIIGKNGAGKSTLLKILSKVTGPTTGRIMAKGRIGALLEVGTGFHPELTGRENIFLNGAILGMTKAEIKSKLDEIIDFSGCARYVDTPVKRYSSGMKVRLAFAVAAFLEPEILIVDEVLAVGDAEFQKKAIGKMQDVSKGDGRTVLFVSHNMASVKSLCSTGIVLNNGGIEFSGTSLEAINAYERANSMTSRTSLKFSNEDALGNDQVKLLEIKVEPIKGNVISIDSGVKVCYRIFNTIKNELLGTTMELYTTDDILAFHVGRVIAEERSSKQGYYTIEFQIPPNLLNSTSYRIGLIFGVNRRYSVLKLNELIQFDVENSEVDGSFVKKPGVFRPLLNSSVAFDGLI